MNKIVVAKLVRLGKDGDKFSKGLVAKIERTNAKVDEDYIKEHNANWRTSGRLYIVDKEATEKRNSDVKEVKQPDRDALKAKATELKLEFKANIKTDALIKLIKDKENK